MNEQLDVVCFVVYDDDQSTMRLEMILMMMEIFNAIS